MIPMPPNQWHRLRMNRKLGGSASITPRPPTTEASVPKTVAPVVVSPLMVSKSASAKLKEAAGLAPPSAPAALQR